MPMLDDGTVIPHYFSLSSIGNTNGNAGVKTNLSLRTGEVKGIIYPDDQRSVTSKYTEYSIEVQHKDAHHVGTVSIYSNCLVANLFGGIADKCTYTLRADDGTDTSDSGLGNGSKVLVLCINGDQPNAIIIGGIRDSKDTNLDQKSDGHHFDWVFNGISANVNDTGELTVTFNGATKADGTARDDVTDGAPGSSFKFSDDGSVTLSQGNQSFTIDTPNSNITITSGDYSVEISSSGTNLGGDSAQDAIIKGTTYRSAQQTLDSTITTNLTTLSGQMAALTTALAAAATALAIPVIGGPLAAPGIAAASVITGQMAATLTAIVAGYQTFEADASEYLSTQNNTS